MSELDDLERTVPQGRTRRKPFRMTDAILDAFAEALSLDKSISEAAKSAGVPVPYERAVFGVLCYRLGPQAK